MDERRQPPAAPDDAIVILPDRIEPSIPAVVVPPTESGPDGTSTDAEPAVAPEEPPKRPATQAALRRERKQLWDEREETVYHIGGLATDLRRRGIEDVELINRRSDLVLDIDRRIADIDANLVEMDARRRTKAPPVAGYCLSCGAPYQTEAAFCFRCGSRVLPPDPIDVPTPDTPTGVIDLPRDAP